MYNNKGIKPLVKNPLEERSWLSSSPLTAILGFFTVFEPPPTPLDMTTPITMKCKACDKTLKVPARLVGKTGNCPDCNAENKFGH